MIPMAMRLWIVYSIRPSSSFKFFTPTTTSRNIFFGIIHESVCVCTNPISIRVFSSFPGKKAYPDFSSGQNSIVSQFEGLSNFIIPFQGNTIQYYPNPNFHFYFQPTQLTLLSQPYTHKNPKIWLIQCHNQIPIKIKNQEKGLNRWTISKNPILKIPNS